MVNSEDFIHHEILHCVAYVCDLPKENLIAGLTLNQCVPCITNTHDFSEATPCEPRNGKSILTAIKELHQQIPDGDVWKSAQVAKEYGLNGVNQPWWAIFLISTFTRSSHQIPSMGYTKFFKNTWPQGTPA
ncbi:hypothetical protein M422DRAFT_248070 [Sphaerobolus stellatus SS14]|nr:hypothetical protein M422DRAFT_248070 [Sphaerobolus stellatus SS14]